MSFCKFWKNFQEQLFEEHLGKVKVGELVNKAYKSQGERLLDFLN